MTTDGSTAEQAAERDAYHELAAYTLTHGDVAFIHQHVVDAYGVQHANDRSKPIGVTFGLVGLYLRVEKRYSGRQVQLAHMKLARKKQTWPAFVLPPHPGAMTAIDVIAAEPGPERDNAIDAWCESIWAAVSDNRQAVIELLRKNEIAT
jgi:hypothetical protein